jgi:hypothetical protein
VFLPQGVIPWTLHSWLTGSATIWTLLIGGAVIGAIFGAFAQQSRFCLRAAAIEFSRGQIGGKVAIWLIVSSRPPCRHHVAERVRPLHRNRSTATGFTAKPLGRRHRRFAVRHRHGAGARMLVRLLVLSATGNLRALLSGLVFAVVAQASLHGFLSPLREALATPLTTITIGSNDLLVLSSVSEQTAPAIVALGACRKLGLALWRKIGIWKTVASAFGVGACIPLAWWFTNAMTSVAFEPVQLESLSFTGPSADTLMLFLSSPGR